MYRHIRWEIKELMIIGLGRGFKSKEVARWMCCSVRTVQRVRLLWKKFGDVIRPAQGRPGNRPGNRPRIYNRQVIEYLHGILRARPDTFLDELQLLLQQNHPIDALPQGYASIPTICRILQREGITRKRLSRIARERKQCLRSLYQMNLVGVSREQMVFVDETRKDDRTTYRRYGYSVQATSIVEG
ncbi:hypothetical protein FN846DRAFT_798888, partial [Sphaerosporella brunnea]